MTPSRPASDLAAADVSTGGRRIHALDTLRGFALCGILIINIYQQVVFRGAAAGTASQLPEAVQLLFHQRFYPIFSILFGIGFGIFLRRAATRTDRPRLVLARRLGVLLLIGVVHFVVHPGEALTAYALAGLLFLLPLSYLGGRAALVVAVLLLLAGAQVVNGFGPIPGLLALGYALAMLEVPAALERRTGRVAVAFVGLTALSVGWIVLRLRGTEVPFVNLIGGPGGGVSLLPPLAGIATGLAYCCGLLLLLRTPLGPALTAVLAPMGRMALTNYLSATVLFLLAAGPLGIDSTGDLPRIVGLSIGILIVQAVWSTLWLRSFRYGPAEWAWRCLTWWRRAPLVENGEVASARKQDPDHLGEAACRVGSCTG
ncbi:DUF418 domain-containing protein [Verrucosispora sp. WMMD1129]|uniref:DUF418 domain-containing protein n=1 Tax=Verrucosispora sp. WMMD1129 TaxID=3016093 RepID=UPI00249B8D6A|nr:DUF418 domain-containing protein [Verrucosispora sp. WMMD1129]WFE48365.1 DUF418 domain-containing protein [Verrucosispora sp. WMMD1129]